MHEATHDVAGTEELRRLLISARVLPVVKIDNADHAVPLAEALAAGGLGVIEVTLRSAAALSAIERIANQLPDVVVGAGTVLDGDQIHRVREAGASFAVSPGLTANLVTAARQSRMAFLPGVSTASEAMTARAAGITVLKLFPAQVVGGVDWLKAIAGPLPDLNFCPTGGINASSMADYLDLRNVLCVGGSWMVPRAALESCDWPAITRAARDVTNALGRLKSQRTYPEAAQLEAAQLEEGA